MRITNRTFGGERPKVDPRNLNDNEATLAIDCELDSTGIRALRSNSFEDRVGVEANTIYFYEGTWVGFEGDVDVIESPAGVTQSRLFWSGDGYPKQATVDQIARGESSRLGVPTPAKPSIESVTESTSDNGATTAITTFYTVTFVNRYGDEGDMSLPSAFVQYHAGDTINVENLGAVSDNADALADYTAVSGYRLYRLEEGESKFVYEGTLTITEYADNTSGTLGEAFVTQDFVAPPEELKGLHLMANGSAVGFVGKTVYISAPYQLNAWPYSFTTQSDVVAVSSFDNTLVVLTTGFPEVATFYDPSNIQPSILTNREPCVSKRSVVQAGGGVIYTTPSNLYFIGTSGGQSLTDDFFSDSDYSRLKPETFRSTYRDGEYYAFHDGQGPGRCIVFDTREPTAVIRRLSQTADAMHVKKGTDKLYLSLGSQISLFEGGSERLTYVWQSKEFGLASPAAIISARVLSEDFARGLSRDVIDSRKAEIAAIMEANRQAYILRIDLSAVDGYGGAINQDTLAGVGTYVVPGLSGVTQPAGVAIAAGIGQIVPNAPEEHVATVAIFADGELVDESVVLSDCVYRVSYHDRARRWWYRITSDVDIQQYDMAGSSSELHDGS